MRRLWLRILIAGVVTMCSGCQVVEGPKGRVLKPIAWHLHDGTYRPFNDVNSGSLWSWNNEFGGYDSHFYGPGNIWRGAGSAYNSIYGSRPPSRN